MRVALALGLALALGARAAGAEAPPDPALELQRAYEQGQYSTALRLGARLTAERPDDVNAHFYYGLALADVGDLDRALAELERARALMPTSPEILFALARAQPDERIARQHLDAARRLAPEDPQADQLTDYFEILLHARASVRGHFPPGSAEAFVEGALAALEAGRPADVILEHVSPSALRRLMAQLGQREPTSADVRRFVEGLVDSWNEQYQLAYEGFKVLRVEPPTPADATTAKTAANLVAQRHVTRAQTSAMRAMYADPRTRGMLDPQLVRLLDGLDPADRAAVFDRMASAKPSTVLIPLTFVVTREAGVWKIADATMEGRSIVDLLGRIDDLIGKGILPPPPQPRRDRRRIGQGVGRMLGIAIGLAVVSWLIVRGRRRRNAALK